MGWVQPGTGLNVATYAPGPIWIVAPLGCQLVLTPVVRRHCAVAAGIAGPITTLTEPTFGAKLAVRMNGRFMIRLMVRVAGTTVPVQPAK